MISGWERFERLAARARADRAPAIAVAPAVLAALAHATPRRDDTWSVALFALATVLAASIVAGVALDAWDCLADPLAGFCPWLTMVVQ